MNDDLTMIWDQKVDKNFDIHRCDIWNQHPMSISICNDDTWIDAVAVQSWCSIIDKLCKILASGCSGGKISAQYADILILILF